MNEYEKINKALSQHENGSYKMYSLDWIANRIDWAWKWRKITEPQMEELADRICKVFERG